MSEVNTGVLSVALNSFLNVFEAGVGRLTPGAMSIFGVLTALELTLAALWWAYSGSEALGKFIKKCLLIFFLLWMVQNYSGILTWVVEGFKYAGNTAAGGIAPINVMEDPSMILDTGLTLIDPMFNLAIRLGGDWNFFDALVTLICSLIVFFAYVVLALQVFLTRLEFALVTTLGLILIPFGVFKHTSFIADKVFGAVLSFGVKLMVLTLIIQISFPLLSSYQLPIDPEWKPMLTLCAISISFAILALHAPSVASSLLSGSPTLSNAAIGTGAAVAGTSYVMGSKVGAYAGAGGASLGGMTLGSGIRAATKLGSFGGGSESASGASSSIVSGGSFGSGINGSLGSDGGGIAFGSLRGAKSTGLKREANLGAVGSPLGVNKSLSEGKKLNSKIPDKSNENVSVAKKIIKFGDAQSEVAKKGVSEFRSIVSGESGAGATEVSNVLGEKE